MSGAANLYRPAVRSSTFVVLIADYIGVDPSGKVNAIGVGLTIAGVVPVPVPGAQPGAPQSGQTVMAAPQHLIVMIDLPSKYVRQKFALSLELRDENTGEVVKVAGPDGTVQPLRLQQAVTVEPPAAPGIYLPPDMFSRVQVSLGFPNGLPLTAGHYYDWRVEIDGQHRKSWRAQFLVAGPPPAPVFGGPAGPADIPNIPRL